MGASLSSAEAAEAAHPPDAVASNHDSLTSKGSGLTRAASSSSLQQLAAGLRLRGDTTALHWAARQGHAEGALLLVKCHPPCIWATHLALNPSHSNPHEPAAIKALLQPLITEASRQQEPSQQHRELRDLVNAQDSTGRTALHVACKHGRLECVRWVLAAVCIGCTGPAIGLQQRALSPPRASLYRANRNPELHRELLATGSVTLHTTDAAGCTWWAGSDRCWHFLPAPPLLLAALRQLSYLTLLLRPHSTCPCPPPPPPRVSSLPQTVCMQQRSGAITVWSKPSWSAARSSRMRPAEFGRRQSWGSGCLDALTESSMGAWCMGA